MQFPRGVLIQLHAATGALSLHRRFHKMLTLILMYRFRPPPGEARWGILLFIFSNTILSLSTMSNSIHISLKVWHKASILLFLALFLGCQSDPESEPTPLDATGTSAIGPNRPNSAAHNKLLAEIRQATVHFKDDQIAIRVGGFMPTPHCAMSPTGQGGMGVHYVHMGRIDDEINHREPEALLYEPQKNGRMALVAVEYIVDAASWDAQHNYPPRLGDQVFDDFRSLVNNPLGFPHYQLHVWVWKHNPAGMHTPFNPNVTCDYFAHN